MEEILPCVDPIASSYKLLTEKGKRNALIISLTHNKTVILPFLNQNIDFKQVRQLNIGVKHMIEGLNQLIQAKYLNFHNYYNNNIKRQFFESNAIVARDYIK